MQLIGLHGVKQGGKDTAFEIIEGWLEPRGLTAGRAGFADKMKVSCMKALGFVGHDDSLIMLANELKTMGEITTTIPSQSVDYSIDGRKYLQLFGTESHRDIFGKDFWVDQLLPIGHNWELNFLARCPACNGAGDVGEWTDNETTGITEIAPCAQCDGDGKGGVASVGCVIDLRFPNEAERIKSMGGMVWEIDARERLGVEDEHESEQRLPDHLIDLTIDNNGTVEEFQQNVMAVCVGELHMKIVKGLIR